LRSGFKHEHFRGAMVQTAKWAVNEANENFNQKLDFIENRKDKVIETLEKVRNLDNYNQALVDSAIDQLDKIFESQETQNQ